MFENCVFIGWSRDRRVAVAVVGVDVASYIQLAGARQLDSRLQAAPGNAVIPPTVAVTAGMMAAVRFPTRGRTRAKGDDPPLPRSPVSPPRSPPTSPTTPPTTPPNRPTTPARVPVSKVKMAPTAARLAKPPTRAPNPAAAEVKLPTKPGTKATTPVTAERTPSRAAPMAPRGVVIESNREPTIETVAFTAPRKLVVIQVVVALRLRRGVSRAGRFVKIPRTA